jgi:hypothetical protein
MPADSGEDKLVPHFRPSLPGRAADIERDRALAGRVPGDVGRARIEPGTVPFW